MSKVVMFDSNYHWLEMMTDADNIIRIHGPCICRTFIFRSGICERKDGIYTDHPPASFSSNTCDKLVNCFVQYVGQSAFTFA